MLFQQMDNLKTPDKDDGEDATFNCADKKSVKCNVGNLVNNKQLHNVFTKVPNSLEKY